MKKINYEFRDKLNKIFGGFAHNYCYQCGACVGDCPAHRFLPEFNPRQIILQCIYGFEEELTNSESLIWNCTNCYNCYERCPQEVHPIEVIIALKNMSRGLGTPTPTIDNIVERVKERGVTVLSTELIRKRRAALGLPELQDDGQDEVRKLMEA
jgi:heterodisulfide reductase subunit C